MKYIKLFENIDWDEDWEETEECDHHWIMHYTHNFKGGRDAYFKCSKCGKIVSTIKNESINNKNNEISWEEEWEEEDPDIYKDYPKNFKEFLIKHCVLEEFHNEFINGTKYDDIKKLFNESKTPDWIWNAFNWGTSQCGSKKWRDIDNSWWKEYITLKMKRKNESIDFEDFEWEEEDDIYSDYPEDFKEFLIENDALEKFHKNFMNYSNKFKYESDLKVFFNSGLNLISTAFRWKTSIEGMDYWRELNRKWIIEKI